MTTTTGKMKRCSSEDFLKLTSRVEKVENFIIQQFGENALSKVSQTKVVEAKVNTSSELGNLTSSETSSPTPKKNISNKRKSSTRSNCLEHYPKRTRSSQRINYQEAESDSDEETDTDNVYNSLLVPKEEVEDHSFEEQNEEDEAEAEGNWSQSSDEDSAVEEGTRKGNHIERRLFMLKLKKIAATTNDAISEIVNSALNEISSDIKATLPKPKVIKGILRKARKGSTSNKSGTRTRTTSPYVDHLIEKLKNEEKCRITNKMPEPCVSTRDTAANAATINNSSETISNKEENESQLLIPKVERDIFIEEDVDEDGNGVQDMISIGIDSKNFKGESRNAEESIEAPWLKPDYVPPVLFKSACGCVLVFKEYTYCEVKDPRHISSEERENSKQIWKCSVRRASGGPEKCKGRMYTWGAEYKVLGLMGEHNHPPRTQKLQRQAFMKKIKEIAVSTDIPVKEIISNALSDTTEEIKATLPKIASIQNTLRKIRAAKRPKRRDPSSYKIERLVKQLSKKGATKNDNLNNGVTKGNIEKCVSCDETKNSGSSDDKWDKMCAKNENRMYNSCEELSVGENDVEAPWTKDDYVAPVLFESASGRVLVFKEYTYCQAAKPKKGEVQENGKKRWKCSLGSARCRARMYTWGPEYKVLGILGEHNHPPRTQKIERRIFMKKLKEIVQSSDLPVSEIVNNALKEATEEMRANLPKINSIQSSLRKFRESKQRESLNHSHYKMNYLMKQLNGDSDNPSLNDSQHQNAC